MNFLYKQNRSEQHTGGLYSGYAGGAQNSGTHSPLAKSVGCCQLSFPLTWLALAEGNHHVQGYAPSSRANLFPVTVHGYKGPSLLPK